MTVGPINARRHVAALFAVSLFGVLAACGGDSDEDPAAGGEDVEVRIGTFNGFGMLPIHIADTQGFFEKNGVKVKLEPITDFSTVVPSMGRQYDVAVNTTADFLVASSKGIPIRLFSGVQRTSQEQMGTGLLAKDPSVKTIEDLEGKRVGLSSLSSIHYFALQALMKRAGMSSQDVTFVVAPFATQGDQLKAGQIDAAGSGVPFTTALQAQGNHLMFEPSLESTGLDETPLGFLATTPDFADKHPEELKAIRAALDDAITWISANEEDARAELSKWLGIPPEVANAGPLPLYSTSVTAEEMSAFVPVLKDAGITGIPDLETLVLEEDDL